MIPDLSEIVDLIARDLPGYGWLLRTIEDDPRDTLRGTGTHFAHVYRLENGRHVVTHKVSGTTAGSALYGAYSVAMSAASKH